MAVSTIVYVLIGFLGYWKYGEETKPTVTLNLPSHMYFAQAVQLLYCLAVYASFAMQSFVTINIIWNEYLTNYLHKSTHPILWEQFIRLSTVFLIFALSALVPFLNLFVALLGVFSVCSVGIIFPAIMHICVKWPDKFGWCKYILLKDIGVFVTGIVIFCIGCYVPVRPRRSKIQTTTPQPTTRAITSTQTTLTQTTTDKRATTSMRAERYAARKTDTTEAIWILQEVLKDEAAAETQRLPKLRLRNQQQETSRDQTVPATAPNLRTKEGRVPRRPAGEGMVDDTEHGNFPKRDTYHEAGKHKRRHPYPAGNIRGLQAADTSGNGLSAAVSPIPTHGGQTVKSCFTWGA
ncbi:hypothetical protein Trydic_g12982 [Trypoxylus dichotomus]